MVNSTSIFSYWISLNQYLDENKPIRNKKGPFWVVNIFVEIRKSGIQNFEFMKSCDEQLPYWYRFLTSNTFFVDFCTQGNVH